MKVALLFAASVVVAAGAAYGQSAKLIIEPGHNSIIRQYVVTEHVRPATVEIPIELGTVIPADIRLQPVPLGMVAKVPEVRNYEYLALGDKVVFVEPYTRQVVQIVQ